MARFKSGQIQAGAVLARPSALAKAAFWTACSQGEEGDSERSCPSSLPAVAPGRAAR